MNKFVSIILLCTMLITCTFFSGCSTPDTEEPGLNQTPGDNENDNNENSEPVELYDVFEMLSADAETNDKLEFFIVHEQTHNELKSSGEYDNSRWSPSVFYIVINCYDYTKTASNEEWYKRSLSTDIKSLNQAFYNYYSEELSKGEYQNPRLWQGLDLLYYSPEDFNSDYTAIRALTELNYVKKVSVGYYFALPIEYTQE